MLEWTSLGPSRTNFPSFCLGLWYGSVCTSGAGLVGGGLGHAPSQSDTSLSLARERAPESPQLNCSLLGPIALQAPLAATLTP